MPTEGTGSYTPYFQEKANDNSHYRGVQYDSEAYNAKVLEENAKRNRHDLMYRGLKVSKKMANA